MISSFLILVLVRLYSFIIEYLRYKPMFILLRKCLFYITLFVILLFCSIKDILRVQLLIREKNLIIIFIMIHILILLIMFFILLSWLVLRHISEIVEVKNYIRISCCTKSVAFIFYFIHSFFLGIL